MNHMIIIWSKLPTIKFLFTNIRRIAYVEYKKTDFSRYKFDQDEIPFISFKYCIQLGHEARNYLEPVWKLLKLSWMMMMNEKL
jgi:hypothetical protein